MSGPAALLAVIGALYLLECIVAVPGGLAAFRGTARASWTIVPGGFRIGGKGMRLCFVPLLPWTRGIIFAAEVPTGAGAFDVEGVRARVAELRSASGALRVDALAMFLTVFVLSPVLVRLLGWETTWPFLIIAVLVIALLIVGDYRAAHAALHPDRNGAPFSVLLTLALSPATAMRACDSLARELFARHHVLAVAAALCTAEEYERIAAGYVRAWRRGVAREPGAEALIVETLGDPARLAAAPARRDASARSYCPSCLAEFAIATGECESCGGVALERFPEMTAAR